MKTTFFLLSLMISNIECFQIKSTPQYQKLLDVEKKHMRLAMSTLTPILLTYELKHQNPFDIILQQYPIAPILFFSGVALYDITYTRKETSNDIYDSKFSSIETTIGRISMLCLIATVMYFM